MIILYQHVVLFTIFLDLARYEFKLRVRSGKIQLKQKKKKSGKIQNFRTRIKIGFLHAAILMYITVVTFNAWAHVDLESE